MSGWRASNPLSRRLEGGAGRSCCPSSGAGRPPFGPLGRAWSGARDAPDELVCQCLLKLGILRVAAIFPAGERGDQCSAEEWVGGGAGVAGRERAGGCAL